MNDINDINEISNLKLEIERSLNDEADNYRISKLIEKQDIDKEIILSILNSHDIEIISTNGYWFQFTYNNKYVIFVNQRSRFILTFHDKDMLGVISDIDIHRLQFKNPTLYYDVVNKYNYNNVVIEGNDVSNNTLKVISMIRSKQ